MPTIVWLRFTTTKLNKPIFQELMKSYVKKQAFMTFEFMTE